MIHFQDLSLKFKPTWTLNTVIELPLCVSLVVHLNVVWMLLCNVLIKAKITRSTSFMADDKETVNHAVAGDIIGLYDTGNYQIGDTLVGGKQTYSFQDLPQFTPEIFMKVSAKNVMKQKHFHKGIEQLVQEGAIQYYKTLHTNQIILGAVGQLQFEVFEHRMKNEYNVDVVMEPVGRKIARWIENEDKITDKMNTSRSILVKDRYDELVFLFENEFATRWFEEIP